MQFKNTDAACRLYKHLVLALSLLWPLTYDNYPLPLTAIRDTGHGRHGLRDTGHRDTGSPIADFFLGASAQLGRAYR
jgi:hypothetical protein